LVVENGLGRTAFRADLPEGVVRPAARTGRKVHPYGGARAPRRPVRVNGGSPETGNRRSPKWGDDIPVKHGCHPFAEQGPILSIAA